MNYSELVKAALEDDQQKMNMILKKLTRVLVHYLMGTMTCSRDEAEDCAQQAILDTLVKIKDNKIREPEKLFPYLLTSCRNNALRLKRYKTRFVSDDHFNYLTEPPRQLLNMLDNEENDVLINCMESLSDLHRTFLGYLLSFPGIGAGQIAEHFGISVASVWSRKHRLIRKLALCINKKMK